MDDAEEFGRASVQYGDWRGTAALDDADGGNESLYELAGISRDEWFIVGLDLFGGYQTSGGRVLAVPRDQFPDRASLEAAKRAGPIRVTGFHLPYGTANPLERFKRWNIHATPRDLDLDLEIIETREAGQGS